MKAAESGCGRQVKPVNWQKVMHNSVMRQPGNLTIRNDSVGSAHVSIQEMAVRYQMELVDLENFEVDRELLALFPSQELFRESILPLKQKGNRVRVAIADPLNLQAVDELTSRTGIYLDSVLACGEQIQRQLKKCLGVGGGTVQELVAMSVDDVEALQAAAGDEIDNASQASSVVKLVNELILEAVEQRASDVHIEPDEDDLSVRYRVDGMLRIQPMPPEIQRFRAAIVSRLKIMAKLNIAERRLPQDGRIRLSVRGRDIDVRVSIIPMLHGEGVVMRLLDKSRSVLSLDAVQFPKQIRATWEQLIRRPHGLLLVTGPTGSGKTTTLYSSLCEIRRPDLKIITIEDPVEYNLKQISQIQVQSQIGLTFAAGLRSILRHDPDVVLIGEIRDAETATSAIQASLTGHLVLSTIHTNDAPSAFTRLVDMGIEPYLVSSTVEGILAQRLVRRLCAACCVEHAPEADELPPDLCLPAGRSLLRATGCRACNQTGYSGRIAIFELLTANSRIRRLCIDQAPASVIRDAAVEQGMQTLRQMGWQRVLAGETSLEELVRVCPVEND
ncbi:MAG: type II/IV secretion system protein [Planctomycetota bacterium]|nr:MAG: type II/IV secretion system protein [Planctomycetota bacterium]